MHGASGGRAALMSRGRVASNLVPEGRTHHLDPPRVLASDASVERRERRPRRWPHRQRRSQGEQRAQCRVQEPTPEGLRQRFQAGEVAGLTDERTIGQLAGSRYRHTARGQVEIERKEDARKRGVKSPDRAEGVMLAFARPAVTQLFSPIVRSSRVRRRSMGTISSSGRPAMGARRLRPVDDLRGLSALRPGAGLVYRA